MYGFAHKKKLFGKITGLIIIIIPCNIPSFVARDQQ